MNGATRAILKLSAGLDSVCLTLAKAALVGMVLVVMLQVAARYGLRQPPSWTEELARYLMVWGGLLGATAAFRRAADPAVVRIDAAASPARIAFGRTVLAAAVLIFILPILYFAFFGPGMDPARSFLARNLARTSPGLGVSLFVVAAAIPTFCIVMLVHLAARLAGGPSGVETSPGSSDVA